MSWNGSAQANSSARIQSALKPKAANPVRNRRVWWLGGGLLLGCLAICVLTATFLSREEPKEEVEKGVSKRSVRESKPVAAPAPERPVQPVEPPRVRNEKAIRLREKLKGATPEEQRRLRVEYMADRPIELASTTNRPFRTGLERSIAQIFMTQLGNMPPPFFTTKLPIKDEAHLMQILEHENEPTEGDSETVAEAKYLVNQVKKELRKYVDEGGKVEEFLEYYHGKLQEAFEERRIAHKEVLRTAHEDPSLAREFLDRVNKNLADKGIKPVDFNPGTKRLLEENGY